MIHPFTVLKREGELNDTVRQAFIGAYGKRGAEAVDAVLEGRVKKYRDYFVVVGTLTTPLSEVAEILGCGLRVWGDVDGISRIAVVGGSAFDWELIEEAASLGAEAYLASELKYNIALESPIPCIEATHYALEAPGMRALAKREGWTFIDGTPLTNILE